MHLMRRLCGTTVLQMVICLAVTGLLLGLAAPAMRDLMLDAQRTTRVNDFVRAVFLARSTAIQRGLTVSLCRSTDGRQCANQTQGWETGWLVFVNVAGESPPQLDDDDALLAVFASWPEGRITANRLAFSFRPHAHGVVNGSVVFCDRRGAAHARAVIINHAGRPRVARRGSGNSPLRCPD